MQMVGQDNEAIQIIPFAGLSIEDSIHRQLCESAIGERGKFIIRVRCHVKRFDIIALDVSRSGHMKETYYIFKPSSNFVIDSFE